MSFGALSKQGSHTDVVSAKNAIDDIRVATSNVACGTEAIKEIAISFGNCDNIGFLLVFVSPHYDPDQILAGLRTHFPGIAHAGCSTAGEIGSSGMCEASVVVIGLPQRHFRVACAPLLPDDVSIETGAELVMKLLGKLQLTDETHSKLFAMTLFDGMCQREEQILAAIQYGLNDIPLVGGSSGGDLALFNTFVFQDGQILRNTGLLLLVRSERPFQIIKSDHFEPTSKRLVVTACNPDTRVVNELNADNAATVFAEAVGINPNALDNMSFANHPLLVRVGGDYYCRSIQKMNADGSLRFYCAIDTGVVLTVAHATDMVKSLEDAFLKLDAALGGIDLLIGFDCIHRRLEAESLQLVPAISSLFRRFRVAGFSTYGEQFKSMHLNYTFTGIAFGYACCQ